MLVNCSECRKEISDQAESCPHCGHPLRKVASEPPSGTQKDGAPFLIFATIALVISLFSNQALVPAMATIGFAAASLLRSEKWRPGAGIVLAVGIILFVAVATVQTPASTTAVTSSATRASRGHTDAVEIADWNWLKDPNFGTRGTIKWNVQVRNKGSENIESVKVEFTTYDGTGKLIATTFTYVSAIPPGEVRASSSFADLYGTESRATTQIAGVRVAR
jgi:hypothetical protein